MATLPDGRDVPDHFAPPAVLPDTGATAPAAPAAPSAIPLAGLSPFAMGAYVAADPRFSPAEKATATRLARSAIKKRPKTQGY